MKPHIIRMVALMVFTVALAGCAGGILNHEERAAIVGGDSGCDRASHADRSDPSSPCFVARSR